jgi:hypothetical protein
MGLSFAFILAGCHGNQTSTSATDQAAQQAAQPAAQESSSDPASANVVPVSDTNANGYDNGVAAPSAPPEYADQSAYDDTADESDYGIQPDETAPEAPPALPDYDQPPCPGDGYIWTPGYWDYASTGYYWVPGAWVEAPYTGALWTPGYWAFTNGRYAFFHGYWGPHIGFYGGINYGFGYVGFGYQGGYWHGGSFEVNRSVNNVNVTVVHNVYNYRVVNAPMNRISFNGAGGIQVRPRPAELQALREPHAPPMATQVQMRRSASENRAQFASANHGRPAEFFAPHPVAAAPHVRPVAAANLHNLPPAPRATAEAPRAPAPFNRAQPAPSRSAPSRPEMNRPEPNRPAPAPAPAYHAAPAQPRATQPEPGRREPAPAHPEPSRPPARPEAAPSHPAPARSEPERRPAPPAHAAPSRPQPEHQPAPQEPKKEEHPHE